MEIQYVGKEKINTFLADTLELCRHLTTQYMLN